MSIVTLSLYEQQKQYIEQRLGREDYTNIDDVYSDADRIFTPTRELKIQAIRDSWEKCDSDEAAGLLIPAEELTVERIAAGARKWHAELRAKYGSGKPNA